MTHAVRWLAFVTVVVVAAMAPASAAVLPLPPPPKLPATTVPAAVEPYLIVAGPSVGALCGTGSLVILLTPSLAQGYLKVPFDELIDPHTFDQYGSTALYLCGFVPAPLNASRCAVDTQILTVLRGLNPLLAQVVGLYPEGVTVDTLTALEQLLPSGPSVVGPAVAELSATMDCVQAAGPPPTPGSTKTGPSPAPQPGHATTSPAVTPPPPSTALVVPAPSQVASPPALARSGASSVPSAAAPGTATVTFPKLFATRLVKRTGVEWLGVVIGALVVLSSLGAWVWARRVGA